MRTPSVKAIREAFPHCDAKRVKQLLTDAIAVRTHPAVEKWIRECYHMPSGYEQRLAALNAELEMHGVEYVPEGGNARSPSFYYLNSGDVYNVTIIRINDHYRIGCVADIFERGKYE